MRRHPTKLGRRIAIIIGKTNRLWLTDIFPTDFTDQYSLYRRAFTMKLRLDTFILASIFGFSATTSAGATPVAENGPGHWAWVVEFQPGPKSSPPSHRHVWIPDQSDRTAVGANNQAAGTWRWVTEVSVGPRAGAPVHHRIWVPAS
jgi:hypothetical protein